MFILTVISANGPSAKHCRFTLQLSWESKSVEHPAVDLLHSFEIRSADWKNEKDRLHRVRVPSINMKCNEIVPAKTMSDKLWKQSRQSQPCKQLLCDVLLHINSASKLPFAVFAACSEVQ